LRGYNNLDDAAKSALRAAWGDRDAAKMKL